MVQQQAQRERPASTNPSNIFADGLAADMQRLAGTLETPETPPEPPAVEEPEEDVDETPALEEPEAAETQPEVDEPEPPKAKRTTDEWVEMLLQDGPQRLSEIPPRLHNEVVAEYAAKREATGRASERQAIATQIDQERRLGQFIANVDAQFANDPDGFNQWVRTGNANEVKAYLDGRTYLTSIQNQTPSERVETISALQQRSARQYNRLDGFPALQKEIADRQATGKYPATDDGLVTLEADVDQLLVDAARGSGRTQAQAGTTPVRSARRPVVNGESRAGIVRSNAGPDISKIKDPAELMRIGVEQQSRRLQSTR